MIIRDSHGPTHRGLSVGTSSWSVRRDREAAILSASKMDAASWRWTGKQGVSTTPSRRSSLATAACRSCPSQTAAVANAIDRSRISAGFSHVRSEGRGPHPSPVKRACSVKDLAAVTIWPPLPLASRAAGVGFSGVRHICEVCDNISEFEDPSWLKPSRHGSFPMAGSACMPSMAWAGAAPELLRSKMWTQGSVFMALPESCRVCSSRSEAPASRNP
jgi:hypothetical protein